MHRSEAELKEFVEKSIEMSGGTMPMTLIARDQEEFDWIQKQLKKAKKKAEVLTVRLDPSVLNVKGIGKGRG